MAELAIAAFSGLSTAAGAATSSLGLSILGGVATVGSVLMGLQQATQTEFAGRAAAQEAQFNADLARLEGERQATESQATAVELRREALRKIGAARVAFAGSGLDISSRQLEAIENNIERDTAYGLAIEKGNQDIARRLADVKAGQYELSAINAISAGKAKAAAERTGGFVTGAKGLLSIARRG